jgi:hypothetical protein
MNNIMTSLDVSVPKPLLDIMENDVMIYREIEFISKLPVHSTFAVMTKNT